MDIAGYPAQIESRVNACRLVGANGYLDGILQAMAPTAQGVVSERCESPLLSFEETVTRPVDGYKDGYNRHPRQTNERCKIE